MSRLSYADVLARLALAAAPGRPGYTHHVNADDREDRRAAYAICPACSGPRLRIEDRDGLARLSCLDGCATADVTAALAPYEEDPERRRSSSSLRDHPRPRPSPSTGGAAAEEPEMRFLLGEHEAGRLEPVPVALGPMPDGATSTMRAVAAEFAKRHGLRLAVDDDRPVPFACSEAVRAGCCLTKPQAWRALRGLVEAGVLVEAGSLPPRGKRYGTKLYAPPRSAPIDGPAGAGDVKARRGAGDVVADEPRPELVDEALVGGAVLARGGLDGGGAAGGGAGGEDVRADGHWTAGHSRSVDDAQAGQAELPVAFKAAAGDGYRPSEEEIDRLARALEGEGS